MNYYIYGYSDKGNYRDNNEDAVLVDHEIIYNGRCEAAVSAPCLTAVCDGVGGENSGEIASRLCLNYLSLMDYSSNVNMRDKVRDIHNKIKKKGVLIENSANMQTTLCCLAIDESGQAVCINVGDSRMYRFVNGTVRQISVDQSYAQFLYEHGQIDDMSELEPEYQNAIISSVGSVVNEPQIVQTPLVAKFGIEPDDTIIIMSDGISDYLTEDEIEVTMGLDLPIGEKMDAMAQLALDNGSTDNVSIAAVKPYIDEEELAAINSKTAVETMVNVEEALAKGEDYLSDILDINVNEIVSHKTPEDKNNQLVNNIFDRTGELMSQSKKSIEELKKKFGM